MKDSKENFLRQHGEDSKAFKPTTKKGQQEAHNSFTSLCRIAQVTLDIYEHLSADHQKEVKQLRCKLEYFSQIDKESNKAIMNYRAELKGYVKQYMLDIKQYMSNFEYIKQYMPIERSEFAIGQHLVYLEPEDYNKDELEYNTGGNGSLGQEGIDEIGLVETIAKSG